MVDCGSGQGRRDFETAGVQRYAEITKSENAGLGRKTPFMDGY